MSFYNNLFITGEKNKLRLCGKKLGKSRAIEARLGRCRRDPNLLVLSLPGQTTKGGGCQTPSPLPAVGSDFGHAEGPPLFRRAEDHIARALFSRISPTAGSE